MNSKAIVTIDTPVAYTNEITLHNIVKQGTIMGPILCTVVTDKINEIEERRYATYGPEIRIRNLLYADDIVGVGSQLVIEDTVKNVKLLEERKKFTFSNIKSIIVNKDRGYWGPKTQVSKAPISMANPTKYLGEIFHNDNLNKERIKKIEKQVIIMCQTLQEYDENPKVRKVAIQVKWKILEAVILPTFFINVKNWTNIFKREMEKIEQLYKKLIYQVLNISITAPYRGVLKETGSWPYREIINY